MALASVLAAVVLAGVLVTVVASRSGDDDRDGRATDAEGGAPPSPLLVDVRTNIDDFDYTGLAYVPEFFTTRPIGSVGAPPNVRLERVGAAQGDANQKGRWTWARQLGAVDAYQSG